MLYTDIVRRVVDVAGNSLVVELVSFRSCDDDGVSSAGDIVCSILDNHVHSRAALLDVLKWIRVRRVTTVHSRGIEHDVVRA